MNLELLRHLVDFGMVVVLWLVQLVIYPSFLEVAETKLIAWHRRYTFRVSFVIMPLMLAQLGLVGWQCLSAPGWLAGLSLVLVLLCWGLTFGLSVPLHRRIDRGGGGAALERLIRTNWPRTFLWSAVFLIGLWQPR